MAPDRECKALQGAWNLGHLDRFLEALGVVDHPCFFEGALIREGDRGTTVNSYLLVNGSLLKSKNWIILKPSNKSNNMNYIIMIIMINKTKHLKMKICWNNMK